MSRKRRLKKLEKRFSGLVKSVSRLERGMRQTTRRFAHPPAKRGSFAKSTDADQTPSLKRTTGRRTTTARKATRKPSPTARKATGAPTAPKATGKPARRAGGDAPSGLPS